MGAGNVNVSLNDGLFYVHYDSVNVYKNKRDKSIICQRKDITRGQEKDFVFDMGLSQQNYDVWLEAFRQKLMKRYPSYRRVDRYTKRDQRIVLENDMFFVAIEDNEWGFAVELIARTKYPYPQFQKHLFPHFFKGMKETLLSLTETIYIRSGSWTTQAVTKDNMDAVDQHVMASRIVLDPTVKAVGGYNATDAQRKVQTDNN